MGVFPLSDGPGRTHPAFNHQSRWPIAQERLPRFLRLSQGVFVRQENLEFVVSRPACLRCSDWLLREYQGARRPTQRLRPAVVGLLSRAWHHPAAGRVLERDVLSLILPWPLACSVLPVSVKMDVAGRAEDRHCSPHPSARAQTGGMPTINSLAALGRFGRIAAHERSTDCAAMRRREERGLVIVGCSSAPPPSTPCRASG